MKLSENLQIHDKDGNVWRLTHTDSIVGGTVLTTMWDLIFDENTDPIDNSPPAGTIPDETTAEFDGRQWHEVVFYKCMYADYDGCPYIHGMRCVVYEVAPAPQNTTPRDQQQEGREASI
jgi:hypothetical protein